MRLIDADALKENIIDLLEIEWGYEGIREDVSRIIDSMPTVEERPHGEWIEVPKYNGYFVCSNCLKRLDGNFERFEHWEMKKENFCPVCGSDNRGARK